jgi:hypothetical protein
LLLQPADEDIVEHPGGCCITPRGERHGGSTGLDRVLLEPQRALRNEHGYPSG